MTITFFLLLFKVLANCSPAKPPPTITIFSRASIITKIGKLTPKNGFKYDKKTLKNISKVLILLLYDLHHFLRIVA